jgi:hypothetical protein
MFKHWSVLLVIEGNQTEVAVNFTRAISFTEASVFSSVPQLHGYFLATLPALRLHSSPGKNLAQPNSSPRTG